MEIISIVPKHFAIIMDGNGRWAKKRFLPRVMGHRTGVETVRRVVRYVSDRGVSFLTLYAFSTENWLRPASEVGFLMDLFKTFIQKEKKFLNDNNVIVKFIGLQENLSPELLELMSEIEHDTASNTGLTLILAVNYGGRQEIARAVLDLLNDPEVIDQSKSLNEADILELLPQKMKKFDFPDPDLIMRTAGEKRLSNFLLWHSAYSEFYFTDKLWPDITVDDLDTAFVNYANRERRFGAL